jgi:type I restriction enzyme M protein
VFKQDHGGLDLIGRVYEYFIGEFASSEGKRGGEYFTPQSIVKTLVAMLEPTQGIVFDPCCGSGGMFVQSDKFTNHNGQLSFVGQESKEFTYQLCRLNLFIHGLDGDIRLGNSYFNDQHATVKANYIIANPPFNDGSKRDDGWGADRVNSKDPRRKFGNDIMPLAPRNANTMWMLHFLHHLNQSGTAGFVMATGELSNGETARLQVRQALVERNYVDCIVQLSGQLFANTQIPCALWFLSKNRDGTGGFRQRQEEILFIDARKLGTLIPGSRKQKALSDEEIERIASVYRQYRREGRPDEVAGFCKVATLTCSWPHLSGSTWTRSGHL